MDMRIPAVGCNKRRRAGQIIHIQKASVRCNSRQPLADQFCA